MCGAPLYTAQHERNTFGVAYVSRRAFAWDFQVEFASLLLYAVAQLFEQCSCNIQSLLKRDNSRTVW
jgi:hypothetical protein